ncbi:MAG: hypothetical protein AB4040_05815 [Synechococcus sp.]
MLLLSSEYRSDTKLMDWRQVLEQLGDSPQDDSVGVLESLKRLNETVTEALLASIKEEPDQAREKTLAALPQLLAALHSLGVNPVQALRHQPELARTSQRLIYIEGNRVEVRVNDELRGSWSIWSIADLKDVCRLAEEFDCGLVYSIIGDLTGPAPSEKQ